MLLLSCHDSEKTSPDKKRKIKQIQTQDKRLDSIDPDEVNNAIQELRQIGTSAVPILWPETFSTSSTLPVTQ